jgi:hypothetical protein
MSLLPAVAVVACTMLVASAAVSCRQGSSGSGALIADYAALKPDQLKAQHCLLELAGSKYKADVRQQQQGAELQIDLVAFGSVVDTERYHSGDQGFSLLEGGGERYDPPIPLVKYPMRVGDKWSWTGKIWTGPVAHETTAAINTTSEDLAVGGGSLHDVLRIDVLLSIESGRAETPAHRKLAFWIAPGKGVIKRMFGDYSTREPSEE